jgi:hypothetical protein
VGANRVQDGVAAIGIEVGANAREIHGRAHKRFSDAAAFGR